MGKLLFSCVKINPCNLKKGEKTVRCLNPPHCVVILRRAQMAQVPDRFLYPSISTPDNELVRALQRSAKKVIDFEPIASNKMGGGSSDHCWYSQKYPGRPFISYGIGRGGVNQSHSYNEYVTIDGLMDTTKVFALLLIDLLGID